MMKQLILISTAVLASLFAIGQEIPKGESLDLTDERTVKFFLEEFINTLQDKDFQQEKVFRTEEVKWWYKSMEIHPYVIPSDSSLAYIGFLDSIHFADELTIDIENRLVMRAFFLEGSSDTELKHRYAFHFSENGLIDGILYVPPITKEYFPNWSEEDFLNFALRLDSDIHLDFEEIFELQELDFPIYSCGVMIPAIEEIEAASIEPDKMTKGEEVPGIIVESGIPYRRL